ncbi:MAG: hypothetical protein JXA08_00650 [Methanomicrobiaceae archaeon]|nr:hypothetical protein [Methanomicrobiaceae archaeon]
MILFSAIFVGGCLLGYVIVPGLLVMWDMVLDQITRSGEEEGPHPLIWGIIMLNWAFLAIKLLLEYGGMISNLGFTRAKPPSGGPEKKGKTIGWADESEF